LDGSFDHFISVGVKFPGIQVGMCIDQHQQFFRKGMNFHKSGNFRDGLAESIFVGSQNIGRLATDKPSLI